jgi:hypothetical protein
MELSDQIQKQRPRTAIKQDLVRAENQNMNMAMLVGPNLILEVLLDIRERLAEMREWLPSRE